MVWFYMDIFVHWDLIENDFQQAESTLIKFLFSEALEQPSN